MATEGAVIFGIGVELRCGKAWIYWRHCKGVIG
jgi:hypothetical protein